MAFILQISGDATESQIKTSLAVYQKRPTFIHHCLSLLFNFVRNGTTCDPLLLEVSHYVPSLQISHILSLLEVLHALS